MKYKIEKHANGKYLVTVSKVPYAYDEQYKTYNDLYFHDRFRDVKKFLNMEEHYTLSLESIINEIKTMENK